VSEAPVVVEAVDVSKKFRLVHERNHSLKATILRGRRVVAEDFWALKNVSLQVREGETFGLIGHNGSGKSTMLKCLTKILTPNEGRVEVKGKVSALLELGTGFHPELSGRENVFLNGAILGLPQSELRKRFDEIVEFAGVGHFIDEPVKNYSSGMYVRLGFSVAINVDPDVLFVDEVLAVGDEAFQRKCNDKFNELKENGKTIVLVTHSMPSVNNLCDRVAWFSHGEMLKVGEPKEVIEAYAETNRVNLQVDEYGHVRWGTGEGRIAGVAFIDQDGRHTSRIEGGGTARLRLHYDIDEPLHRPVFATSFSVGDDVVVCKASTRDSGLVPEKLDGKGHVDVVFEDLRLMPGRYKVSASLTDHSMLHEFDYRKELIVVDVDPGTNAESGGLVSMRGKWELTEE
jgi:ABC-2 type transport system ATP-binding protein